MQDETSILRQVHRESIFKPPYCPNQNCNYHKERGTLFWKHHGVKKIKRFPYLSRRYQCRHCKRTFSASFFHLYYRQKVWGKNEIIFILHHKSDTKLDISRFICHSEHMVRDRLQKMARWGLLFHAKMTAKLSITEPIVYDGLENFSFSQYEPNNVNHAVGKFSLFTYDFNLAPMNRKGKMSPRQKNRSLGLEKIHGRFPSNAIRSSSSRIFERLLSKTNTKLTLITDKHFQYRKSIEQDIRSHRIEHFTVSSKVARNFKNHLFAVNNIDLLVRHNLAAFRRETIAFSKHSIAMLENFSLYVVWRNYMRPKFWKQHKRNPLSNKISPAMELGLTNRILTFNELFRERICSSQVELNSDWKNLFSRIDPFSRHTIATMPSL